MPQMPSCVLRPARANLRPSAAYFRQSTDEALIVRCSFFDNRSSLLLTLALTLSACSLSPEKATPDLSGSWVLTTRSQFGAQDSDMTIKQTGRTFTGTVSGPLGNVDCAGTVDAHAVVFGFSIVVRKSTVRIDYRGTIEGDSMSGDTTIGSLGHGTFSARRTR